MAAERQRLREDRDREKSWKRWGPYLSERQWGTVREDYSEDGNCWNYFPHSHARSRAYRWGEDGLLGIMDRQCRLCLALALWNTEDPFLKERLFGLNSHQGNHGEDVKELYYYLDSTPTHSYMKALYKYSQEQYPYDKLVEVNSKLSVWDPEYEIEDTDIFDENKYWDVCAEYCKQSPEDILGKITVSNRGPKEATIHVLPTLWFRNSWSWGKTVDAWTDPKPQLKLKAPGKVECFHPTLGEFYWEVDKNLDGNLPDIVFTENETNFHRLFQCPNQTQYVKDAFHYYVTEGNKMVVNPDQVGTKCAAHYILTVPSQGEVILKMRLFPKTHQPAKSFSPMTFDEILSKRKSEADDFYDEVIPNTNWEERNVARQAYAGLLWSKQFYYYIIKEWLAGDQTFSSPPNSRLHGRNCEWKHLFNRDILSMPDKWEYPWYASWDLAFHMIPFAEIDIEYAKQQLLLFLREWYMHPNGQIPAYEFSLGDVNPPVHAYACLKVFKASGPKGNRDIAFLARCFHKLVLNFTWWVNRKDPEGKNIFSGGFLGLDNICLFDRSRPLPIGGYIAQADGTAWMAFFCVIMLEISLILSRHDHIYEDMASKFFEHFIAIVDSINNVGNNGLWHDEDGFYYDHVRNNTSSFPLKIRSIIGMVPLFSSLVLSESKLKKYAGFYKRMKWFLENREDLVSRISFMCHGNNENLLLAVVTKEQLIRVLEYLLDESEFLSPYGIRSLSKYHKKYPFVFHMGETAYTIGYEPGESNNHLFGGNSNWRGPIWLCMNHLLIENLNRYDYFYGESVKVECPRGSRKKMRLRDVAKELAMRMSQLFLPDTSGYRPCHGKNEKYAEDSHFKDLVLFHEYFHGDTGRGCGASHQTGWTAMVVNILNASFYDEFSHLERKS